MHVASNKYLITHTKIDFPSFRDKIGKMNHMKSFIHLHPHRKLQLIIIFFLLSWLVGTFLIHRFESAQHWSYFDAFYFTVITTATIGFWDLVPHSMEGKILTMLYAIIYVPLFLYSMTLVFQGKLQKIHEQEELFERNICKTEKDVERIIEDSASGK